MPTTEIAVYPTVAGSDVSDPSNPAAVAGRQTFALVGKQPGLQHYYLGMQVESPEYLEAMINWESLSAHEEWKTKEEYGPANALCAPVFAGGGAMYHVDFEPYSSSIKAFSASITEVVRLYFNGVPPPSYLSTNFKQALEISEKNPVPGMLGIAAGITYEELEYEGVKGKAVVVVTGWESLEKHKEFMGTDLHLEVGKLLMGPADKWELHHVRFSMRGGKDLGK